MDSLLVTGATGCTGKGILQYLLSQGYEDIYALVRKNPKEPFPNINYIEGDLRDKERLTKIMSDYVVHHIWHTAAAVHRSVKRKEFYEINTKGTMNLLEAAIKNGTKSFSYTSTAGVYGKIKETPVTEDHNTKPWGKYSQSKLKAEQAIKETTSELGISGNILRLPMILGKGDRHVFPVIGKLIKLNLLPILGNPNHNISIVHPYDVARALEIVTDAKSKNCETFHVVSCNVTWRELIVDIEKHLVGKKRFKYRLPYPLFFAGVSVYEGISTVIAPRKEPVVNREYAQMVGREWVFDTKKIEKLGFKPIMDREEIIKDVVYPEPIPVPIK